MRMYRTVRIYMCVYGVFLICMYVRRYMCVYIHNIYIHTYTHMLLPHIYKLSPFVLDRLAAA
jgi:hypothetical protein